MVEPHVTDSPRGPRGWWRRLPGAFRFGIIAATIEMAVIVWLLFG